MKSLWCAFPLLGIGWRSFPSKWHNRVGVFLSLTTERRHVGKMAAVEIHNNLSFGLLDWRIYLFPESVSGQKAAASGQVFFTYGVDSCLSSLCHHSSFFSIAQNAYCYPVLTTLTYSIKKIIDL